MLGSRRFAPYFRSMKKLLPIVLMLISIAIILTQVYLTAKSESNDYFYLLPIGIAFLLAGIFFLIKQNMKKE
jgi:hypothetical protein